MAARTRLLKELKEASRAEKDTGVVLTMHETNLYSWTAKIQGPPGSPYEGGTFELRVCVPDQYPLLPPLVRFRTRIFHPNIHFKTMCLKLHIDPACWDMQTGEICLDILKTAWTPAWTLQSVCQAIMALLCDAAPESPLNCDAGALLRSGDVRGYNSLAQMYTRENAM